MDINLLKEKIDAAEKIVIYGCGKYGKCVYTYLDMNNLLDKLMNFTVTSMGDNNTEFMGVKVYEFKGKTYDKNTLFIIAMKRNVDNVFNLLSENGFNNVLNIDNDLFYSIEFFNCSYYLDDPVVKNRLLFISYGGLGYCCNPKYIANEIIKQKLNVEMVWVVKKLNTYKFPKEIKTVLLGSSEFYKYLSTSEIIICNYYNLHMYSKKENQYYIQTWHGCAPLKKIGLDEHNADINIIENIDLYLAGTQFYSKQFRLSFLYNGEIANIGCPRDDILFNNKDVREKVYEHYNIPTNKKVILYAPTFRDDFNLEGYNINVDSITESLNEYFNGEFIFAYRLHHNIHGFNLEFESSKYETIDMTYYDDVQELIASFDVLITDYSSIMWDFSLTKKPVFLFQTDAEKYELERGFYTPFNELPYPIGHNNEELCEQILNFDEEKYIKDVTAFHDKNVVYDDGHASERAVEIIKKRLGI